MQNNIKQVILDQKEEIQNLYKNTNIISREIENKQNLLQFLKIPNVLVITGIRRCGKSTLATNIVQKSTFAYINFDDERLKDLKVEDLNKVLQTFYEIYGEREIEYYIFDEIQNIPGWELFITRLRKTKKIIITGSNSKLLSNELATHLTGRYKKITLYPFTFKEFLIFHKVNYKNLTTKGLAELNNYFKNYLEYGGFAENYLLNSNNSDNLYQDILYKDISLRYKIRNQEQLRDIAGYLVSNYSKHTSIRNLARSYTNSNIDNASNYVGYLKESYLICELLKYNPKLKEQHKAVKKYYCIDSSIIKKVAYKNLDNFGELLENTVFNHLKAQNEYRSLNNELYYLTNQSGHEVDFLIKNKEDIQQLMQVTAQLTKENYKREVQNALKWKKQKGFKNANLKVLTYFKREKGLDFDSNIEEINVIDYLLK